MFVGSPLGYMVLMDTLRIIIGLLVLCGITLAAPPEDGIHDSKRIQSSGKPDHYISQTTVDSPNKYPDPYDLPPDQIEISEKYEEPQRHQTPLQDEYHEEKTIQYMDDKKVVSQAYKFGFEIKDKKEGMQFRQEEKDEHGTIQGIFGYRDAKGQYRHVEYVADDHGFRANIKTNEAGLTNENPANVKMYLEDNTAHYPPSKPTAPYAEEQHPEVHKTTESVSESDHHTQQTVEDTSYKTPRRSPLQNYPGYEAYHHQKHDDHEVTYYRDSSKPPVEKPRSHAPRSYNYFVNERNPHTGYEHSSVESEPHHESPRPSHASQDRSPKSTYQYKLEGDRYQYKYVKRPSHSDREASQDSEEQEKLEGDRYQYKYVKRPSHSDIEASQDSEEQEKLEGDRYQYKYVKQPSHSNREASQDSEEQDKLEGDRYQYKYVKRPSNSDREASQNSEEQDYRAPKYEYQDEYGHEASPKHHPPGDYEGHRNREIPGYKRRVILPQREPHQTHDYQRDHQDNDEQDYRVVQYGYSQGSENEEEEKQPVHKAFAHQYVQVVNEQQQPSEYEHGHPSPYGYRPREKEVQPGHSVVYVHPEPEVKQEPEHTYGNRDSAHQGIKYKPYHAINQEPEHSYGNRDSAHQGIKYKPYHAINQEPEHSYGNRDSAHQGIKYKPYHAIKQEPEHSYGHRDSLHQGIKYKPYHAVKLDGLTGYHGSSAPKPSAHTNGRLKIGSKVPKKAVLELNPEVYKKLIENKSPGTRFVAVPVNEHADKKSHRGSPQPHGILHIPLNGETPSSLDLKSLVLQIPQKPQEEKTEKTILKYRDYIEQAKRKQEVYSQEEQPQITPIYKPIRQHNKDYSKTKWIPITQSNNQGRRKVPYEVNTQSAPDSSIQAPHGYRLQVSNEDAYKLLQGESSLSSVSLKRSSEVSSNKEISSLSRKKSPRLYVLGSSFVNITPLTDLKRLATPSRS